MQTWVVVTLLALLVLAGVAFWQLARKRALAELEASCVEPEVLRDLLAAEGGVLVFDVRQPLDLLAHSEIIPGAVRIPPKDLLDNPKLIPLDKDAVVYCTCDGEKTSRSVVARARAANLVRLKLLKGGFGAWKAKGYPVEPYGKSFRLDTAR
jgi:rhodanese-related sulfurtransferase